jgi:hydroxymethylpyrimidine/phosphomethylpyrimidine kinase
MRVTRLDLDPENGGAWVSVCLGRRTEHADAVVDTVLQWRSQDLLHGPAMTELLDELLPAVRILRSAQ